MGRKKAEGEEKENREGEETGKEGEAEGVKGKEGEGREECYQHSILS